jgi:hypothetical protein
MLSRNRAISILPAGACWRSISRPGVENPKIRSDSDGVQGHRPDDETTFSAGLGEDALFGDCPSRSAIPDLTRPTVAEEPSDLAAVVERLKSERQALRRDIERAEETIAELTEIGDAAQAAIDRLRTEVAIRGSEAREAMAQRDAVAAELFRLALQSEEIDGRSTRSAELVTQRDALAAEPFRSARRTKSGWIKASVRRLFRVLPRRRGSRATTRHL